MNGYATLEEDQKVSFRLVRTKGPCARTSCPYKRLTLTGLAKPCLVQGFYPPRPEPPRGCVVRSIASIRSSIAAMTLRK